MTGTPLAVVVLTHADPAHLHRMAGAFADVPMFVHCDARTSSEVFGAMVAGAPRWVEFVDRLPAQVASWSLVQAELTGVAAALRRTDAQHIAVLSGSCYPLLGVADLCRELEAWSGRTWLANVPMPYAPWRTPRYDDGGMWRLEHRFITRHDNVVLVNGHPLRLPIRRRLPRDIEPRAASQWKIYARQDAQRLLDILDDRSDLRSFWRSTLVPDESFSASMLGSRALFGSDCLPLQSTGAWFLQWDKANRGHPRWLSEADFPLLEKARWAEPLAPDDVVGPDFGYDGSRRKLFARKVSSERSAGLLGEIDQSLRD